MELVRLVQFGQVRFQLMMTFNGDSGVLSSSFIQLTRLPTMLSPSGLVYAKEQVHEVSKPILLLVAEI